MRFPIDCLGAGHVSLSVQAHTYHAVGKSRHIVLTSEARSPWELRGPADVAGLGWLLGLSEAQGKQAVAAQCWQLHKAAVGRRMGPFQVRVEKLGPETEGRVPDSPSGSDESVDSEGVESDMETAD